MSRKRIGSVVVAAALIGPAAIPASADVTTVNVERLSVLGDGIVVRGTVVYGGDATGEVVLGTDPANDAQISGAGLDLASISVRPDLAAARLVWTLRIHDGIADPVTNPPATGYMVPVMADGNDRWRWLAAGNAGTGWYPQPGRWTGLCTNEEGDSGKQGGYTCPTLLAGSVAASGVTWLQPFASLNPPIDHGSIIMSSSIWCARPCSFPWLVVARPHNAVDMIDAMAPYKVPGEVTLAIAPAGLDPAPELFTGEATWTASTSTFTGTVATPSEPGTYTVWARTCFGRAEAPTCILGSADLAI